MDAQAGMPARLFERSTGPGPERRVEDVWFESPASGDEEPHVRVGRVPGAAVACPGRGARRGACDARELTWRHLDIWRFRTVAHCRVPRANCHEHGPGTARAPREARPSSHFTALFEAQVLVMAMSGMSVRAVSLQVRESDSRMWAMLGRAVAEAREGADHPGVTRVGIDDTARARGRRHTSAMADVDGRRVAAVTEGRDRGAPGRLCDQLEERGGDRSAVSEVTRDTASPHSPGRAEAMPGAAQAVGRLRVMRLLTRALDGTRCAGARSREGKRRPLGGARHAWPKRPESLTGRRAAKRASLASGRLLTARLRDGGGGARGLLVRDEGGGRRRARPGDLLGHALQRARDEEGGEERRGGARGGPQLVLDARRQRLPGGHELGHPVAQARLEGLRERRLLHNDDLPQAGEAGLLGPVRVGMCYPLETWKSPKKRGASRGPQAHRKMPLVGQRRPALPRTTPQYHRRSGA